MSVRSDLKDLCRSLGTYDSRKLQEKFPDLSRQRIAKLVAPYSEAEGTFYLDESNVAINKPRKLTTYHFIERKARQ